MSISSSRGDQAIISQARWITFLLEHPTYLGKITVDYHKKYVDRVPIS